MGSPDAIQALLDRVRTGSIDAEAEIHKEITDWRRSFDLYDAAIKRGTALWRAEAPAERDLILPDTAKLVAWLLERLPVWRPIETAPVPPREVLGRDHWRCLLQEKDGTVLSGYGTYTQKNASTAAVPIYEVRWYGDGRANVGPRVDARYWMPLPTPHKEE